MLLQAGGRLCSRYPWLEVEAVVLDYTSDLHHLEDDATHQLFVFLGGTLGNFTDAEARTFLSDMRMIMQKGDRLLVGVDRAKDIDVLNAAYNDTEGITAEFNRNVLRVLNRELDADFNLDQFEHQAWFNSDESRIEMHLRSASAQQVKVGHLDCEFGFEQDETILTEISRKFTPASFQELLSVADFAVESHFEPDNGYFSLFLLRPDKW
jgi:L-histidine N-alpha-methyltransferase